MADTKTTALTENTAPILTDIMPMVDDPGGSAATQKVTMTNLQGLMAAGMYPGGRLTLTTATPVTTADVTGATTLYYTPYIHDNIRLYDGTSWRTVAFTEKSLSLAALTASKPYDIWGYLSSGTLALEALVWTDGTTRATALAYQNGRLVKSGDATRLYLGTIYINSSGGQTDSSVTKRFVWNYYNRVGRMLYKTEATQHNYTTGTTRSWNNDATVRVEMIIGVEEDYTTIGLAGELETAVIQIGYDSTSTPLAQDIYQGSGTLQKSGITFFHMTGVGYHYYQGQEYGFSGATEKSIFMNLLMKG